jgi:hypothetical protein
MANRINSIDTQMRRLWRKCHRPYRVSPPPPIGFSASNAKAPPPPLTLCDIWEIRNLRSGNLEGVSSGEKRLRRFISGGCRRCAQHCHQSTGAVARRTLWPLKCVRHFGARQHGVSDSRRHVVKAGRAHQRGGAFTTTHITTDPLFFTPMLPKDANRNPVRCSLGERSVCR